VTEARTMTDSVRAAGPSTKYRAIRSISPDAARVAMMGALRLVCDRRPNSAGHLEGSEPPGLSRPRK
jgi:hypothetical protein